MSMEEEKEKRTDESTTDTPIQASYSNSIISRVFRDFNKKPFALGEVILGTTKERELVIYKDGEISYENMTNFKPRDIQVLFGVDEQAAKEIYKEIPKVAFMKGRIHKEKPFGNGIFWLDKKKTNGHPVFTFMNGTTFFNTVYTTGGAYEVLLSTEPIIGKRIITFQSDYEGTPLEPWINVDALKRAIEEVHERGASEVLKEQFDAIEETLKSWQFESKEMRKYLTAFIMLAPFHILMDWRPYLWITGRRGTGKTLLFDIILKPLYTNLIASNDNPTDFSVVQDLDNTGLIPLLDNFEPSQKAQQLLKNFEIASRGGLYTRGTTGQKPRKYKLNHMLWFNSVMVVSERSATDSRIVEFRLKAPPKDLAKLPETVSVEKIIAGLIDLWDEIESTKNLYVNINKNNGRMAENVAYANALLQLLEQFEKDEDELEIPGFVMNRPQVDEGRELLEIILLSSVLPDLSEDRDEASKKFVYEALRENGRSIISKGIWIVMHNEQPYITVEEKMLAKGEILRATKYEKYPGLITSTLRNVDGALYKKRKDYYGKSTYGVLIPVEYLDIVEDKLSDDNIQDDDSQENDENDEAPF